jgi:ATP-dependent Clp protease ATP-binding subunit ClpC
MTWIELKNLAINEYYPALFLERVLPHKFFRKIQHIAELLVGISLVAVVALYTLNRVHHTPMTELLLPKTYGLFFLTLPLWMIVLSLRAFYYSYYFKGVPDRYSSAPMPTLTFELAHILYRTQRKDILRGFIRSRQGRMIMLRAGISQENIQHFLKTRKKIITAKELQFETHQKISVIDYILALYSADKDFTQFLFAHQIQQKDLEAIVRWVVEREVKNKMKHRWWSKDRLGRIPGLGKNWAYGRTFSLDDYTRSLPFVSFTGLEVDTVYGAKELQELESILVKTKGGNVFLVGDDREELLEIIARLENMIEEGTAFPELEHKRIIAFDTDLVTSVTKTKQEFESKLLDIMHEADYAGNTILVIVDFPSFVASAEALGSDIISLLDRYFTSPMLHIVGLSDSERFHAKLERNAALMQRFEKVLVQTIDENNTVRVLENEIIPLEQRFHIVFTYPALIAIAESAERYFPDAIMPDRAIDLLNELAPKIAATGKKVIVRDDVLSLVTTKTGIPIGDIHDDEREKLLNLENTLHRRIIGQDIAVQAIANAVRRARSGINNPNRPMASFLFLGPTGVGKTETTKALADVFFGAEAQIERLDMSEYAGNDALPKLIGSFESGKAGVLSTLLREHPYGVLLLDEFEKTTPEVMNLFLQILDEGFFSDSAGKKINARNLLIIATSNAGSDLIWEAVKHGDNLSHAKELIIDSIIKANIFKPELLNRFDGVIVFHPLGKEHLEKIARLQLEKLQKRLALRGINLIINDELVEYLLKYGSDPKFGARPMNRAIQDKVEQVIAEKMISGQYKTGSDITLSRGDLDK